MVETSLAPSQHSIENISIPPVSTQLKHSPSSPTIKTHESLIDMINKRIANNERFFSLEFFPPKTVQGASNLITKFEQLAAGKPLFCDITWHPAGDPSGDKPTSSMKIAAVALNYCNLETMLHLTCYHQTLDKIKSYLDRAKNVGLRNILALRGDPHLGQEWEYQSDGFNYATDLVKFIRKTYGHYFVICVAGYPHGHPESTSYDDDLIHLKEKVDAGADFIITQLFFRVDVFLKFVDDCRKIGIKCPIIPGILPIQSYDSLRHICKLSKLEIPTEIIQIMENIKGNDDAIREYGIDQAVRLCQALFESGYTHGLHFYTLNREVAVTEILKRLNLWNAECAQSPTPRCMPWKHCINIQRKAEDVRPIFWSIRPKSYVYRTENWDQFPNGRWGNSAAPSFGALKDYHLFFLSKPYSKEELKTQLGYKLEKEEDVWQIFKAFVSGEKNYQAHQVKYFPWSEEDLAPETSLIKDKLRSVNEKGILTINSQPNVNGLPSSDPVVGWGFKNGYVYQKAYLEFFTSSTNLNPLLEALELYPRVNFHIINKNESINLTNCDSTEPNAITWGVFPGKEIVQPTVVDPISFLSWKDEAFNIWHENWGYLYDDDASSKAVIEQIEHNYILVNLVDNNFPEENCLWDLVDKIFELKKI